MLFFQKRDTGHFAKWINCILEPTSSIGHFEKKKNTKIILEKIQFCRLDNTGLLLKLDLVIASGFSASSV